MFPAVFSYNRNFPEAPGAGALHCKGEEALGKGRRASGKNVGVRFPSLSCRIGTGAWLCTARGRSQDPASYRLPPWGAEKKPGDRGGGGSDTAHPGGSLRGNCPACFGRPTAPEAKLQDTTSSQDTQQSAARQSFHQEWQAQSYFLPGLPTLPSPGVHLFSRGTAQVLEEGAAGPALAWRAWCLSETQLRQMVPCSLGWELRQGTGPRAGAPRHTKTPLLGTYSSKQSQEPLVPAATEEWIPPRERARRCSGPLQVSRTPRSPAQTPH